MAEAVVSFLLQRLRDIPVEESNIVPELDGKIERLQKELTNLKSFLKDADARQREDEAVRRWVATVREVAYDIQDTIDTLFTIRVATQKRAGLLNVLRRYACILQGLGTVTKIALEVEKMTSKIEVLVQESQRFGLNSLQKAEGDSDPDERSPDFGFDYNIKELVDALLESGRYRVVSICGRSGLGKSTLAKRVYYHSKIRQHFQRFAWTNVPSDFRRKDIWQRILLSLTPKSQLAECSKLKSKAEISAKLRQVLQQSKCLVILVDICSDSAWNSLTEAFPDEGTSSKILLTSSSGESVAVHADCYLHKPLTLNNEDGWKLLQNVLELSKKDELKIDGEMEKLGKEMVECCRGSPLAIIVLGGLLSTKHTLDEWKKVHEIRVSNSISHTKSNNEIQV